MSKCKESGFKVIVTETVTTVYESNNTVSDTDGCAIDKDVAFAMCQGEQGFKETAYQLVKRTIKLVPVVA